MGKFTNSKHVPSFLKEPNYYAKHEKFDDEVEESVEECQTCGNKEYMEKSNEGKNMVKSFASFLMEKKGVDLTGDGKVDGEDWKAARDIAIKGSKAKAKGKAIELPADKAKKKAKMEPEEMAMPAKGKKPAKKAKLPTKIEESLGYGSLAEGHICHTGTHMCLSEAAHCLIECACENIAKDAHHYHEHIGSFEDYIGECAAYMENKMYHLVDDGQSMNENWMNEGSACYEGTKHELDAVCEAICHEGLHIHNDPTPMTYNHYVDEAIGCYKNGMMECAGYAMNEEASDIDPALKAKFIQMCNDTGFLAMSQEQQAKALGVDVPTLIKLAQSM